MFTESCHLRFCSSQWAEYMASNMRQAIMTQLQRFERSTFAGNGANTHRQQELFTDASVRQFGIDPSEMLQPRPLHIDLAEPVDRTALLDSRVEDEQVGF